MVPTRCIFCRKDSDQVSFTREHIFPESIGGTLVIETVCKTCNDYLGSKVDKALVDNFLIQMVRMGLRLHGKSGRVPSPLDGGYLDQNRDIRARYKVDPVTGSAHISLIPKVEHNYDCEGVKSTFVLCDESEFAGIMEKLERRMHDKGLRKFSLSEKTVIFKNPTVTAHAELNALVVLWPLFKIAYELGTYWLGPDYVDDPYGAELRRAILSDEIHANRFGAEVHFFPAASQFARWADEPCHIGMLAVSGCAMASCIDFGPGWAEPKIVSAPTGRTITCFLRIFNILEAELLISKHPERYKTLSCEQFVIIDPMTRSKIEGEGVEELPAKAGGLARSALNLRWFKDTGSENEAVVLLIFDGDRERARVYVEL